MVCRLFSDTYWLLSLLVDWVPALHNDCAVSQINPGITVGPYKPSSPGEDSLEGLYADKKKAEAGHKIKEVCLVGCWVH